MKIVGEFGEVCWGYAVAVTVREWSIVSNNGSGRTLTGTIVQHDSFRASQRPLMFVVPRPHKPWRWSVLSLQIAGASLTATLGPLESSP